METRLNRPPGLNAYEAHRIVAATMPKGTQFLEKGTEILCRPPDTGLPSRREGEVLVFTLRASCGKKTKGRHRYFPLADRASRLDWLARKAKLHGFEVVNVHVQSSMARIDNGAGRLFTIDRTDFVGVLRVTDPQQFALCQLQGVGGPGKAFGHGMLIV